MLMTMNIQQTSQRLQQTGISTLQARVYAGLLAEVSEGRRMRDAVVTTRLTSEEDERNMLELIEQKISRHAADTRYQLYRDFGMAAIVMMHVFCYVLIGLVPGN